MDRNELENKVIALVAVSYNRDASELSTETNFKEELKGASVQMVALVAEIENELDATITLQDAAACTTIGDLVNLVEEEM